ncbi:hypothetical protein [Shewanella sp.]|uniref:hypothetical protein n=1 Tax=Shewanella sp. TaxID=50422 RepID=UPI004048A11D
MPRRKGSKQPSKNFTKQVRSIVQKELKQELEEKTAVIGMKAVSVLPNIPNGNVSASPNFVRLLPFITQANAAKQYNGREGNEIRLKNLNLKMLLQWVNPATQQSDEVGMGIRVMILKQKDENSATGAIENFQGQKLLENGEITVPGPSSFTGTTLNLFQKINRSQFSVRYDKVHFIERNREVRRTGVNGTPLQYSDSSTLAVNKPIYINKTITFGKRGLKLTYGDSTSDDPTNFGYFVVIGYANTFDDATPANNLVEYTYTANAQYTDA